MSQAVTLDYHNRGADLANESASLRRRSGETVHANHGSDLFVKLGISAKNSIILTYIKPIL